MLASRQSELITPAHFAPVDLSDLRLGATSLICATIKLKYLTTIKMKQKEHAWTSEYKREILDVQSSISKYRGLIESDLVTFVNENVSSMGIMNSEPTANAQKAIVLFALAGIQKYLEHNPRAVYDVLCATRDVCMNPLSRIFKKQGIVDFIGNIKTSDTNELATDIIQFDQDLQRQQLGKLWKKIEIDASDSSNLDDEIFILMNEEREAFKNGENFYQPEQTRYAWSDKANALVLEKFVDYDIAMNAGTRVTGRVTPEDEYDQSWQHLVDIKKAFDKLDGADVKLKRWFSLWMTALHKNNVHVVFVALSCIYIGAWLGYFETPHREDDGPFGRPEKKVQKYVIIGPYKLIVENDESENYVIKLYKNGEFVKELGDFCAICLEDHSLDDVNKDNICMTTACQHFFHCECSKNWFEQHKTCPVCKTVTTIELVSL